MSSVAARLVVPRHDRGVLIDPPVIELADLAHENARWLSSDLLSVRGNALKSWRAETRAAVLAESRAYTESLNGETIGPDSAAPLIVTGHQPELFHAGVWAKNFAAAGLAERTAGTALNLIIDNDTVSTTRIKIPVGPRQSPGYDWIPFDATMPQRPWEDARISDQTCFDSFGQRVTDRIRESWDYVPLVSSCWGAAVQHASISNRLCDALTAARHCAERMYGLRNLEVPMSRVCSTLPFCRFVALLLHELPQFRNQYNETVRDYRRIHHLKSTTHPVPELESIDDWHEAPFWIWRAGDYRRERPFARRAGDMVEVRDNHGVVARIPATAGNALDHGAEILLDLARQGIRLRTRALTTTLFARVFLADLFIHGIGGARYDAMTDAICARGLGLAAPPFATVSATANLPLSKSFDVTDADWHHTQHQLPSS